MKDILDEISTDLKQENLIKFAKNYGKYLLYLSVAIILTVALYIYMHDRTSSKQEAISTEYFQLFEPTKHVDQVEIQSFIKQHKGSIYADLATLQLEGIKPELQAKVLLNLINTSKYVEVINPAKVKLATIALLNNLSSYKQQSISLLQEGIKERGYMENTLRITLAQLLFDAGEKDKAKHALTGLIESINTPPEAKLIANALGDR